MIAYSWKDSVSWKVGMASLNNFINSVILNYPASRLASPLGSYSYFKISIIKGKLTSIRI